MASFSRVPRGTYACGYDHSLRIPPGARSSLCHSHRIAMSIWSPFLTLCSEALTLWLPEITGIKQSQPIPEYVPWEGKAKMNFPATHCSRPGFRHVFPLLCFMHVIASSHAIPVGGWGHRRVVQIQIFLTRRLPHNSGYSFLFIGWLQLLPLNLVSISLSN